MEDVWFNELVGGEVDNIAHSLLMDSDDDEGLRNVGPHGGSVPGKAPNLLRGRLAAAKQIYNDYFSPNPVYHSNHFSRRFRLCLPVFRRIVDAIEIDDPYFTQRQDCTGQPGFTNFQKATAAIRILAYGSAADSVDEYVRIAESTSVECLEHFCESVIACFGQHYMHDPTVEDLSKILERSAKRGFPRMIGSIDCSKWVWKNFPAAYRGRYQGKEGVPALKLECIADDQLYIWHAFFGMPGCANDINVLNASTLQNQIADGTYPPSMKYKISGTMRNILYWLADGIYPKWPCFVQTVSHPTTMKEKLMAASQESARKDVERAFGVLQAKWQRVARPSRFWYTSKMQKVMKCCVVLYNMMVEYNAENGEIGSDGHTGTSVGSDANYPMWACNIEHGTALPPPGSIGAICAVARFPENESEY